jgi:hypothetical protein
VTLNVVHRPIPAEHEELVVLNTRLRLYAALASDGRSFHVIQPARIDDARVGDGKVIAGDLVCTCPAGQYARVCWATKLAQAFERGIPVAERDADQLPWATAGAPGA